MGRGGTYFWGMKLVGVYFAKVILLGDEYQSTKLL